ncbi:hypothetical protein KKF69_00055 [Patescibacteria group bacterium]|nr:hypothetical protein [Patescibacteria group bacterium]MBU4015857.1 hypothetical protein [Patescibacteria group bacterium]
MSNNHFYKNISFLWLPVFMGIILLIGFATSIISLQQTNNIQAKAESSTASIDQKDCAVPSDQLQISSQEQKMLDQINAHRTQYGLNNLVWSDTLINASKWMSRDMLKNQYLGHTDSLGRDVKTRLSDCGYSTSISIAENLDSGVKDSTIIFQTWKHSPPQNANLLSDKFKEAGIALASDPASDSYYWTLDLGGGTVTMTPTPSIIITPTPTQAHSSPSPFPTNRPTPTSTPEPTFDPTPTTVPGFTPNPLDMQFFVSAKVIGIGEDGNRNPKHFTRYVTVSIYDMDNKLVKEGNGYIIYDRENLFRGIVHFGPVENGIYYIKILSPRMLKAIVEPAFRALDSKILNILPRVTLIQGDINADNVIDIADYNISLGCFQDKKCEDKNLIDFNDDGLTDIIDYNILLRDYWEWQGD